MNTHQYKQQILLSIILLSCIIVNIFSCDNSHQLVQSSNQPPIGSFVSSSGVLLARQQSISTTNVQELTKKYAKKTLKYSPLLLPLLCMYQNETIARVPIDLAKRFIVPDNYLCQLAVDNPIVFHSLRALVIGGGIYCLGRYGFGLANKNDLSVGFSRLRENILNALKEKHEALKGVLNKALTDAERVENCIKQVREDAEERHTQEIFAEAEVAVFLEEGRKVQQLDQESDQLAYLTQNALRRLNQPISNPASESTMKKILEQRRLITALSKQLADRNRGELQIAPGAD